MQIVQDQRLILGPPGTGKTTRSLNIVEEELSNGVPPNRIAYISFTKKAVEEASGRAMERFNYERTALPFFRTLHSLCYMLLQLRRTDVMAKQHMVELGDMLGYKFSTRNITPEDGFPVDGDGGDKLLFIDSLARNRCVTLEEQWHEINDQSTDLFELRRLHDGLKSYKTTHNLFDYTDMLERVVEEALTAPVDVAIIDEAQDLSALQWEACRVLFAKAKRVYIAGDDDQSIFKWAGADVDQFLTLGGKREVLGVSYRLPRSIHRLACSTINRVKRRFEKSWVARDAEGTVDQLPHIDAVDFEQTGTTMLLTRNAYLLNDAEELLRKSGRIYQTRYGDSSVSSTHYTAIRAWERLRKGTAITGTEASAVYDQLRAGTGITRGFKGSTSFDSDSNYKMQDLRDNFGLIADGVWHDALDGIALNTRAYYLAALRAGAKLNETPRIRLSTIHAAKGGEADNVILLTSMSQKTYNQYQRDADDERRVFYVGMTRAKRRLTLIDARNDMGFNTH